MGRRGVRRRPRARTPILLSIGYSACHWCHVMAHESFEDADVAAVMNRHFVNVKVDREERPDVDDIYMEAVQAMTGHGGWPMTVFMTPDGRALLRRHLLPQGAAGRHDRVRRAVPAHRRALAHQARGAVGAGRPAHRCPRPLGTVDAPDAPSPVAEVDGSGRPCADASDPDWGGFGRRPKFPSPWPSRPCCAACGRTSARPRPLVTTLDAMAAGGIYDHLGGGFARYVRRRGVAGAPLREDALRQRPADPPLPPRLAAHRRGPLPAGARGDDRLRAARPAPARRRHVLGRGRRQRGRGGQVLRLDRHPGAGGARRGRRRGPPLVRLPPRRQLRARHHHPQPHARPWPAGPPPGGGGGPAGASRGAGPAGAARARRQGAHRVERLPRGGAGRGGGRRRRARLGGRRRRDS